MKPQMWVLLTGLCSFSGCAQSLLNHASMESRVIEQFADALDEENETALRHSTSTRFETLAFQSEDVLRDLRVMHLPTGKLSVVDTKDAGKGRREVIVKEESGGKYQFHLVNDPVKKMWVVDDVVVRQRSKGTQVTKSTTEVMQLLATLRSFLDVWEGGSRDEIFAVSSVDLKDSLGPLPDAWLQTLTSRIASNYEEGMARKPSASLYENEAVVKLPARNGHLLIKLVKSSDDWLVDDIEAHNHREENHPGSVRRQADAIQTVNGFLTAYAAEDHETLQELTQPKLYESSLKVANLSMIELPLPRDIPAEYDLRAYENRLTVMLPAGSDIVRLDLAEVDSEPALDAAGTTRFMVRDVTLYDRGTQRQRSLSAVFTAPTRAALFLKALSDHNHQMLTQMSTSTFSKGTWDRIDEKTLPVLPIPDFSTDGLKLTDSHSIADTTELEFESADGRAFSCRLVTRNGVLKIDDLQYPNHQGQVTSLKTQLSLSVPLIEFSHAWAANDIENLQKASSTEFNRLVWSHLQRVPTRYGALSSRLMNSERETKVTQERATVRFLDGTDGLSVSLVMEHDYWVVDDVQMEPEPGTVVTVRQQLRNEIAERILSGSYSTVMSDAGYEVIRPVQNGAAQTPAGSPSKIRQVSGEFIHGETRAENYNRGAIVHPLHQEFVDPSTGRTKATRVTPAVRTREYPPSPQDFAEAGSSVGSAAVSEDVVMFGPEPASQVSQQSNDFKSAGLSLDQPIDMTPASDSPSANSAVSAAGESGAFSATLQNLTSEKPLKTVRQPADAPISFR